MGDGYLANPLTFVVQVIFGFYALLAMLRFLLQAVRADFYNPLSQFIVKATSPVLNPLRRIVPPIRNKDTASLLLAWLTLAIEIMLVLLIAGRGFQPLAALLLAIPELVELLINIFLYGTLIMVIISWINPGGYNPAIGLLHSLTEPLLRPARSLIPPIGGLDLSPMVVMIGLVLLKMLLVPPLKGLAVALL
ncbi:MAG: YggT family protein [Gammaproteobacteria bacterium]|nr:MAG: YggT family protein [Gammaproteobacteria bacterium]